MKKILSLAVIAFLALTVPALAGIDDGNGEIGFDYGNTNYDSNTGLDTGSNYSLRGGYFMTRMIEIEGQYSRADEDANILGVNVSTSWDLMMVNGVFNFHPREEIIPYFRAGIGRVGVEQSVAGLSVDDNGSAYQYGGGSRFFFGKTKRAAFRVDFTVVNTSAFDTDSTNTTLSGGFAWRLGR